METIWGRRRSETTTNAFDENLSSPRGSEWVLEDEDDRVSPEEHLADEPVLVNWLRLLLSLAGLGQLSPHLLYPLQHHVAVAVKSLHPAKQLLVVPAVDQNLGVVLHRVSEDSERSGGELLLLLRLALLRGHICFAGHISSSAFSLL